MLTVITFAVKTVIALAQVCAGHPLLEALAVLFLAVRFTAITAFEVPFVLRRCPVLSRTYVLRSFLFLASLIDFRPKCEGVSH